MLAAIGVGVLILAIFSIIIGGLFMWLGAKIAGIEGTSYGKAVSAAVAAFLITWFISAALSVFSIVGNLVGMIIGMFLALLTIKSIFNTTLIKALIVWVFNTFSQILAIIVSIVIGYSLLDSLFRR